MFNQMTTDKLNKMKLYAMAAELQYQLESPKYNELSFEERFGMIVDKEMTDRENRKLKNLLKKAKLRYSHACIEDINFTVRRGLTKEQIITLSRNDWIERKQNVIITGSTGTGKTYIACALGNSACRAGISAYYVRLPDLLEELSISTSDGSLSKIRTRLSRIKLLILDDWGFDLLSSKERRNLFEVIEDRYDISATIISSQLPIEKWHDSIGDPTVADAICDRLIHNAHRIKISGGSMRKHYSNLTE